MMLLGALAAMGAVSLDTYLPAMPQLAAQLGATTSQTQLTLTACMVGLAVGQLVAGPISDRTGRRKPLLIGLLAYTVMSGLCAVAGSVELLIAARLGQGLTAAVSIVIGRAVVRDLFTGDVMVRVFATVMIALGVGPIVAPIIGAQLLRITDWRGTFIFLSLLSVLLAGVVAVALPETLSTNDRSSRGLRVLVGNLRTVMKDATFLLGAGASALCGAAFFVYLAVSPFVLQDIYQLSPQWFSVLFAVNAAGFVLGGQLNRPLMRIWSPQTRLAIGTSVALIGGGCLVLAVALPAAPITLVCAGFLTVTTGYGLTSPNGAAIALTAHGHRAGAAAALFGLAQYGFGALVAPLGGIAGASLIPTSLLITGLSAAAIAAAITLLLIERQRNTVATSSQPGIPAAEGVL
jgi:MFS transporter, DHA1 family, multidrug resistance protein